MARTSQLGTAIGAVLRDVLDTRDQPRAGSGRERLEPAQSTEAVVGPYELQDFHLYYILRFGYLPTKVAFMSWCTWRDREVGEWPGIPEDRRREYAIGDVKKWLRVFVRRFFQSPSTSAAPFPTHPRWAPAAPSRRAAITARPATAKPQRGWPTWSVSPTRLREDRTWLPWVEERPPAGGVYSGCPEFHGRQAAALCALAGRMARSRGTARFPVSISEADTLLSVPG